MQDNNPQEFDEQFVSQAWLEMRQLLDKEMPVRQRQRPAWWLWLLAGLFLLTVSGSGVYYLYHEHVKAEPAPNFSQPTANSNGATNTPSGKADAPAQSNSPVIEQEAVRTEYAGAEPVPEGRQSPPPISLQESGQMPPAHRSRVGVTHEEKAASTIPAAAALSAPTPSTVESTASSAPLYLSALTQGPTPVVSPLKEIRELEGVLATYQRPGILKAAVEGSVYSQGRSAFDGFGAGLALEAHPRESRIYLRTGAFFRSYQQGLNTSKTTLRLENSFSKMPQPDGSIVNSNSQLYSSSTIEAARYIQAPLTAGFRWKPRLWVEAGVQGSFLVSGKTTSRWSLSNQTSTPVSGTPLENTIYEFKEDMSREELNAFSLDLIAGLAYRAGQRTSLRVFYQYGLIDFLDNPKDEAFLRGLQLSLAYYILD